MKTTIIMKNILRKAMVLTVFCSLSIFLASADFSNPDEGWKSSTGEKTIFNQTQTERKPFGEDDALQAQLRAAPGGGDPGGMTGVKEVIPVGEGIWVIVGLAIAYGVARRKKFKKETL